MGAYSGAPPKRTFKKTKDFSKCQCKIISQENNLFSTQKLITIDALNAFTIIVNVFARILSKYGIKQVYQIWIIKDRGLTSLEYLVGSSSN